MGRVYDSGGGPDVRGCPATFNLRPIKDLGSGLQYPAPRHAAGECHVDADTTVQGEFVAAQTPQLGTTNDENAPRPRLRVRRDRTDKPVRMSRKSEVDEMSPFYQLHDGIMFCGFRVPGVAGAPTSPRR
jgi:hypothetical protein